MHTILITGAGTGIGAATARKLSGLENTRLLLVGRRFSPLEKLIETLDNKELHSIYSIDISDVDAIKNLLASESTQLKKHPLVNVFANAGIGGSNSFSDGEKDTWSDITNINLSGTYNTCMASIPWLQKAGLKDIKNRNIVITSSCLARFGVPNKSAYVASKTGLLGLVRSLASEYSREGILTNAINPGWVDTEMARESIQAMADDVMVDYDVMLKEQSNYLPTGRFSHPNEIAELVAFLFSGVQQSITGQAIDINGGSWMG
jgi:NAD(P)-dependent dehydrogenase (short-subunit alcohol dehydrogenase family)